MSDWVGHAQQALEGGGYRVSAPRAAVVSALDELGCSVTAQEISDRLRERGEPVARYEPVYPNGEHHHHLVCDRCGRTKAFEDPELERVIERLAGRVEYSVGTHDVTLRGTCPSCRDSA